MIRTRILIAAVFLTASLSGCSAWNAITGAGGASTQEGTVVAFEAACTTYKNVFAGINLADKVHPLSDAAVAKVNAIDVVVEGICPPKGALPGTALDGIMTVLSNVDALVAAAKQ